MDEDVTEGHEEVDPVAPTGPVEVPLPFLLAISVPAVAVVLYILMQLSGNSERRAALRALREAGIDPDEPDDDAPDAA